MQENYWVGQKDVGSQICSYAMMYGVATWRGW